MSIRRSAWLRSSSVSATGSAVSSASLASNARALMVDGPLLPVSSTPSTGRRTSYSTSAPADRYASSSPATRLSTPQASSSRTTATRSARSLLLSRVSVNPVAARPGSAAAVSTSSARLPSVVCASARASADKARQRATYRRRLNGSLLCPRAGWVASKASGAVLNSRAVSASAASRQPVSRRSQPLSAGRCRRTSLSDSVSSAATSSGLASRARRAAWRCACSSAGIMASGP